MIEPVVRLRIELEGTSPQIWRSVDIPESTSLKALHEIIQATMRWDDMHLFEFIVGDRVYGEPSPDDPAWDRKIFNAKNLRLKSLIARGVDRFRYVYDFGDNWNLTVIIDSIVRGEAKTDYPAFVAGARRAPPEDVGGVSGFESFLEAVTDPRHEDHIQMVTWNDGRFDPDDIDERDIRISLESFAARRRRLLTRHLQSDQ